MFLCSVIPTNRPVSFLHLIAILLCHFTLQASSLHTLLLPSPPFTPFYPLQPRLIPLPLSPSFIPFYLLHPLLLPSPLSSPSSLLPLSPPFIPFTPFSSLYSLLLHSPPFFPIQTLHFKPLPLKTLPLFIPSLTPHPFPSLLAVSWRHSPPLPPFLSNTQPLNVSPKLVFLKVWRSLILSPGQVLCVRGGEGKELRGERVRERERGKRGRRRAASEQRRECLRGRQCWEAASYHHCRRRRRHLQCYQKPVFFIKRYYEEELARSAPFLYPSFPSFFVTSFPRFS